MPVINNISELRDSIIGKSQYPPEYLEKMVHKIPELPLVKDRAAYLVEKSKDKVVLDIGCTRPISKAIKTVAKKYYGVDNRDGDWEVCDIDHRPDQLPKHDDVKVVIDSLPSPYQRGEMVQRTRIQS